MARAVLTTGANMGDRACSLDRAMRMIGERAGDVIAHSSVRETSPWGDMEPGAEAFLNQLLVVETHLGPEELLDVLHGIERDLGRERRGALNGVGTDAGMANGTANGTADVTADGTYNGGRRYLSRTIDIDIIFYDGAVMHTERLTIPHPLAAKREFVLALAAEIMPEYVHPANGATIAEMLDELKKNEK